MAAIWRQRLSWAASYNLYNPRSGTRVCRSDWLVEGAGLLEHCAWSAGSRRWWERWNSAVLWFPWQFRAVALSAGKFGGSMVTRSGPLYSVFVERSRFIVKFIRYSGYFSIPRHSLTKVNRSVVQNSAHAHLFTMLRKSCIVCFFPYFFVCFAEWRLLWM